MGERPTGLGYICQVFDLHDVFRQFDISLLRNTSIMSSHYNWILIVVVCTSTSTSVCAWPNYPCGTTLNATSDVEILVSPNYPRNYDNNLDCFFHITAPEGERVYLTTSSIDGIRLEDSKFCTKDFLQIINGPTGNGDIMTKSCGEASISVLSVGQFMTILFHTDDSINSRGFNLLYRAVNQTDKCPKQVLDVSDTKHIIESPNYPQNYPLNTDCEWSLVAPQGYWVYLEVNKSSIEQTHNCVKDHVVVTDSYYNVGWELEKFCGDDVPPAVHSTGIFMNIVFHSDDTTTGSGFRLLYSARPGISAANNVKSVTAVFGLLALAVLADSTLAYK